MSCWPTPHIPQTFFKIFHVNASVPTIHFSDFFCSDHLASPGPDIPLVNVFLLSLSYRFLGVSIFNHVIAIPIFCLYDMRGGIILTLWYQGIWNTCAGLSRALLISSDSFNQSTPGDLTPVPRNQLVTSKCGPSFPVVPTDKSPGLIVSIFLFLEHLWVLVEEESSSKNCSSQGTCWDRVCIGPCRGRICTKIFLLFGQLVGGGTNRAALGASLSFLQ